MSIVNLESALRTCKTDSANAERILSDRFLNPQNMVCPVWNGLDAAGRVVGCGLLLALGTFCGRSPHWFRRIEICG